MVAAVLVFLLATGAIVGGYLAVAALPGLMKQRQLDRRIREISAPVEQPVSADSVVLKATSDDFLDRMTANTRGGAWLGTLIEQSGVRTTPSKVILMSLGAAVFLGVLAAMLVRPTWLAPIIGAVGLVLPAAYLIRRRGVRMRKFEEMFPEALDLLSRAVKAGHAFQTAMNMAAEELPDPVGPEFRKTFDQQNFGLPLRDALNAMAVRIPIIDVKFFVTAVLIQRETGGNLSEILDNLSHVVRERFKVLRQVRVHTAHGRFTGWVLLALPASLAVVMAYINPEHMQLLFEETLGRQMLMAAVVMQTIGFFWIKRVIKIEV
jgi:tight adherence protein B